MNPQIATDCERGWMAWMKDDMIYVQRCAFDRSEKYPWEGGGNVSVFVSGKGKRMAEREVPSPVVNLAPGERGIFAERWELYRYTDKGIIPSQYLKVISYLQTGEKEQ